MPNPKDRDFETVRATACWGIENCKERFGLGSENEALSAAFEAGTEYYRRQQKQHYFGSSGIVSQTLDHLPGRDLLGNAFRLIESLHAELFKSRDPESSW